jgi:4-hydroxy-tetrahydrodipicolinate reductase
MTRLAIIGAAGRMGGMLIRCADQFDELGVMVAIEQAGHAALGRDAGVLAGRGELGVAIGDDLASLADVDTCIDFTFHEAVPEHVTRAAELGKRFVLGTTGLTDSEADTVKAAADSIPIVWAPNMSVGMNLLFVMVEEAARRLGPDYDAEIVEVHHRHKKDSPSGTALRLAKAVAAGRDQKLDEVACFGREGQVGERPRGEIGIHAIRSGDVVGDHTVSLGTDGERVEFTHRASSRDAFAMGALRAALWLADREPGLYDMRDVLGL